MTVLLAAAESTVMVVDDEPANIALLERLLALADVQRVHSFTDPREALDHCWNSLPDLVLLDLQMPYVDGFAFMAALRQQVPENRFLPILVLTADVTREVKERALESGATDFLTKPFDRTEVLLRVANLLETRALHRRLEQHNDELQTALDEQNAAALAAAATREAWHRNVDTALRLGALAMVYQPVADLITGDIVGVEALSRFTCEPTRPPNQWFAEAESIGRGTELELASVAAALDQFRELEHGTFMALNVSPSTAVSPELVDIVAPYPAERLVIELTEHNHVRDYGALLRGLEALRSRGIRIAVDDTGAGYAGFQHLLELHPDIVKLDISLTRNIANDPVRRALATALVTFAFDINAVIVAEGIEAVDELQTLSRLGIQLGQGYHLARPGTFPMPDSPLAPIALRSGFVEVSNNV